MAPVERFAVYVGVTALLFGMLCLALGYKLLYLPGDIQAVILLCFVMVWTLLHLGFRRLEAKKANPSDRASQ